LRLNGNDLELLVSIVDDYNTWAESFLPTVIGLPEDDDDGDGLSNDDERLFGLDPTSAASANPISVPLSATGAFSFTRRDPALTGKVYQVRTSTNLIDWEVDTGATLTGGPVVDGVQTVTVQISAGLLTAPRRFVRVTAGDPVPLLATDFEANDGAFTQFTAGGTEWEYGTANSPTPTEGAVISGNSGTQCWGTNLTGGYAAGTDTSLRSPVIDLTHVTAATLTFAKAIDASAGHTLVVNVIDDTTDTVIANVIPAEGDANVNAAPWETIGPVELPAGAYGQPVRIEWRFIGDGNGSYNGAYIDDVVVNETSP
jgi:bacillopeptidase F